MSVANWEPRKSPVSGPEIFLDFDRNFTCRLEYSIPHEIQNRGEQPKRNSCTFFRFKGVYHISAHVSENFSSKVGRSLTSVSANHLRCQMPIAKKADFFISHSRSRKCGLIEPPPPISGSWCPLQVRPPIGAWWSVPHGCTTFCFLPVLAYG